MREKPLFKQLSGFTRFELLFLVILLAILGTILLNRVQYYQELGEKTAMEMTVQNIRTGLRYKLAELMVQGREAEKPLLLQANPVMWLQQPPDNYIGAGDAKRLAIRPGTWYYDTKLQQLVYRLNNSRYFQAVDADDAAVPEIRFRIQAVEQQRPGFKEITDIRLVPVNKVAWF